MQACLTLGDALVPRRTLFRDVLLVLGASIFIALTARIVIPIPFSPIPATAQTLAVLLGGNAAIYLFGLFWLSRFIGMENILAIGLYPFAAGDLLKLALATAALPLAWKFLRRGV